MELRSVFKQINISNFNKIEFEKDQILITGNLMIQVITCSNDEEVSNSIDTSMEFETDISLYVDMNPQKVNIHIDQGKVVIYPQQAFGNLKYEREAIYVGSE